MTYTPMSSILLRKRGHCCKSGCLHCPYGFTLKKFGLKFEKITNLEDEQLRQVVAGPDLSDPRCSYHKVILKDHLCAIIKVNHLFVLELYHMPGFEDQGLFKEMIESYYF